jgi:hypothetical protein
LPAGGTPSGLGDEDLSQRREQLLTELGPPPTSFSHLGPVEGGDDDDLASEELTMAATQPPGPGPLL